ncbi:hypothetical protein HDV05_000245 [Chytridiales sp. JEL 0842]|nr:hypothetical protein HDV05_000245 [Chytridiales sp. JEL 0842]
MATKKRTESPDAGLRKRTAAATASEAINTGSKTSRTPSPSKSDNGPDKKADAKFVTRALTTIFIALLIDILAFTIILPLYPRLLEYYEKMDGKDETTFFYYILTWVRKFKTAIGGSGSRLDIVLFGGVLGSMFSFLQFVSSPFIGSLSDRYGRKNILLISMIGNALSMLLWIFSKSFVTFVLSRVVGGLTEGNVQMSIAMISDITTPETRSRGLALVGIAFSLGFTVGPPLGAYFASLDLLEIFPVLRNYSINSYSSPALFAFVLIMIETVYMYIALPETTKYKKQKQAEAAAASAAAKLTTPSKPDSKTKDVSKLQNSKRLLNLLSLIHFLFLFFFSGMEFTLTFLTHDRFSFTHAQQGRYLGFLGVLSACVQGGYVRRVAHRSVTEKTIVLQGMIACSIGLFVIGFFAVDTKWLYIGASFLAFTSGTVVTSLTSLASLAGNGGQKGGAAPGASEVELEANDQGRVLGKFRALGQLGRATGPLIACSGYWILGSQTAYGIASLAIAVLVCFVALTVPRGVLSAKNKKA